MDYSEQSAEPWLDALLQITRQMDPERPFQARIVSLLHTLTSRLGFLRPHLVLFDPETGQLRLSVADAQPRENHANYTPGVGVTGHVFATGHPVIVEKLKGDPLFLSLLFERTDQELEELSFISVPVLAPAGDGSMSMSEVIGTLNADTPFRSSRDLKLRCLFLETAASLIAYYSAFLRRKSHSDPSPHSPAFNAFEHTTFFASDSRIMHEITAQARQLAKDGAPVLISGESGVGKETLASWMHEASSRREGPFLVCRCPMLSKESLMTKLCGFQKGTFLGAMHTQKGIFEEAATGTVFLQSVDLLPQEAQAELLRLIKEQKILRCGAAETVPVNVRIIASTSASLEDMSRKGSFLKELGERLRVNEIHIPPLREHISDITPLAEHILNHLEYSDPPKKLSGSAVEALSRYFWPGNIDELTSCLAQAAKNCKGNVLRAEDLPPSLQISQNSFEEAELPLVDAVSGFEKKLLLQALEKAGGNMLKAAKILKTSYRIVNYKIKKYQIDPRRFSQHGR